MKSGHLAAVRPKARARLLAASAMLAALGMAGTAAAQNEAQDAGLQPQQQPDAPTGNAASPVIGTAPSEQPRGPVDPRDAMIVDMRQQMQELAEQVADLKAQMASGFSDVREVQAKQDKVVMANGKPSLQSADGKFTANLHGVMQFDAAHYFQNDVPAAQTDARARDLNDGTNFRRARIGIDGKAFSVFNYNVLFDFGGTGAEDAGKIQELWVEYAGFKPARLRIGAFAPLLGLEDANSTNGMPFLERPAPAEIARSIAGGDRRSAIQLAANGDHWSAAAAITGNTISSLNSAATGFNSQNYDEQLGYTGRATIVPFHGQDWLVHAGVNASYVSHLPDAGPTATLRYAAQLRDRPELTVDTTRLVDTGSIDARHLSHYGFELAGQMKSFYVQGEYFHYSIDRRTSGLADPSFHGWYVEGSWVLTGEARKYNTATAAFDAPAIANPYSWGSNKWGAFELAARYSDTDLNYRDGDVGVIATPDVVRGGEQRIFTAGLNWYLNPVVRLMFDYQHVDIDRINAAGLEIGQDYNAIAMRTQLAF